MPRRLIELSRAESMRRLASASYGRIVFTRRAMPAIRPINHIVDDDAIVVRTQLGAAVLTSVDMIVAYQADDIDPVEHIGWSVVVTGIATRVRDRDEVSRYERLLRPWVNGKRNEVIRISAELVTGYELVRDSVDGQVPR